MIPWFWLTPALAGVHVLEDGQTVTVPLNVEVGTVLQLPAAVKLVTPTSHVLIERVDEGRAPAKGNAPAPALPVHHLRARVPEGAEPMAELVTIVLADGQAVPVRFVPTPGAEPFADLQRPRAPVTSEHNGGFLAAERELMLSMFRDEPYRREVLDETIVYEQYPALSWQLRRRFRGDGLTGYVFMLENRTKEAIRLDPSVLAVDQPNRAVLVQVEDEALGPCQSSNTPCRTVLRMVVREAGASMATAPTLQQMPFVRGTATAAARQP